MVIGIADSFCGCDGETGLSIRATLSESESEIISKDYTCKNALTIDTRIAVYKVVLTFRHNSRCLTLQELYRRITTPCIY